MLLQWLTFAVMILIQAVAAISMLSAIRTTLVDHGKEIERLRDWRHRMAAKEMVYDEYGHRLDDHESRIRATEQCRYPRQSEK